MATGIGPLHRIGKGVRVVGHEVKRRLADERAAHGADVKSKNKSYSKILIGPEGGFSESEFEKIDKSGAEKMSLGKTVLRAETAAVVAISKVLDK